MLKYCQNNFINIFFYTYLISYICGPAIINIVITLISIFCFFYLIKNFFKIFASSILSKKFVIFFIFFFLYLFIKEFFYYSFNIEFLSFLRFFIIFIFLITYLNNKNNLVSFNFNFLLIILFILTFDTFFQFFFGFNLFGFEKFQDDRLTSFFDDEPIIGSFILKILFPSLTFISYKIRNKNLLLFGILFSCFAILISGERMPFLQMIFGLLLIFVFFLKPSLKSFSIISLLLTLLITSISLLPNVKNRYIATFDGLHMLYDDIKNNYNLNYDFTSRHGIYDYYGNFNTGIQLWKKNKFFGNGYRNYKNSCFDVLDEKARVGCSNHPHNIYIELLADHGIIGLILFLFFLIFLYLEFFNRIKDPFYYGFFISSFVISVPFVTSQSIYSSYYGSIYFLFLYMIVILLINKKKS